MEDEQISANGIDPDKPISDEKEDLLGRRPVAHRIADMINNLGDDYKDSVVIGIEGEWGSGKSSLINLILNRVHPEKKNLVIEFNPWNFSNQNELIKDLFDSIATELDDKSWWGKVKGHVSRLFGRQTKANKIWNYGLKQLKRSEIEIAPAVSIMGCRFQLGRWKFPCDDQRPLGRQKAELNDIFENFEKRMVIVIDDIDRLDVEETKLIFKLVKRAVNFPNTVFILAYDRLKVGELLNEAGLKGEEYLKKIVQVSFLMPKLAPEDIFSVFASVVQVELDRVSFKGDEEETKQLRSTVNTPGFIKFFQTIRDIKRYANSLRLDLMIVGKEEINMGDFLGIEAIRVFVPKVYLAMTNESYIFTTVSLSFRPDESEKEIRKNRITLIMEEAPKELQSSVKEVIFHLFPQVEGLYSRTDYNYEFLKGWRKAKRICAPEMFDRYFQLSVPPKLLSEGELRDFLSIIDDISVISERLKKFANQGKLRLISARLLDYLDDLSDQQRENILISIFDLAEEVMDRKQGVFDFDTFDDQAGRIGYQTLKRVERVNKATFLLTLINATQGVFVMSGLLLALNDEIEKEVKEGLILTEDEMTVVDKAFVEKVKVAAQDGSLLTKRNWRYALRNWKKWGEKEEAEAYVKGLQKTDDSLITLLRGFISESAREAEGEFQRISRIDRDHLGDFLDLGELDKRVSELDLSKLNKEDAELVELYKNPPKDPRGRS